MNDKDYLWVLPVEVQVSKGTLFCPRCGAELFRVHEFPDTRTTCEFHGMRCENGHLWQVQHELQDDSLALDSWDGHDEWDDGHPVTHPGKEES